MIRRVMIKYVSFSFFLGLSMTFFAPFASAGSLEDFSGLWVIESEKGRVEIADCGDGTPCGTLVWVKSEQKTDMPLDINNKEPELRVRPLIGIQLVYGFEQKKDRWKNGKIYNPEDGRTYRSSMRRLDYNTLEVKGCLGPICKAQIWKAVEPER